MLVYFVGHRLNVIERRTRHELAEREARLHIIKGLLKALDVIDQVIVTIKKSKTTDTARENLIKQFGFSEIQARAILAMQLSRLAAMEQAKLKDEGRELWQRIKYLKALLGSEIRRLEVVIEETTALKTQFATPRRTVIIDREDQAAGLATTTEAELVVPDQPQVVAMTTRGLVRADADGFSYKVKPGASARAVEAHLRQFRLQPEDTLLLVSNQGRAWKAPVGRVPPSATFAELGLGKGEYLIGGGVLTPDHYLTIGSRAGQIKRTKIQDLSMGEASWATVIGLNGKDEALFAAVTGPKAEVMFFTAGGKAIRFAAAEVNPQATGSARGVAGIRLGKDDSPVAGDVLEPDEPAQVVVVSQTGFAKRVDLTEFPLQGRGGQGVQSLEITKATGKVATATVAGGQARSCDVFSAKGLRHRLEMADVPLADRRKRGEKLVDFGADDAIVGAIGL
jgi:DNA gyrase subunit A